MNARKISKRALIAILVIVVAIVWGVNSLLIRSYSGTDLNFGIGSGPVKVTNPSDSALPMKLVATGLGTFTVLGSTEGVSGRSTSQGSGRSRTQLFEFSLPSGESELRVVRGSDVNFVANTDTVLKATVQPLNAEDSQTRLGVMVIAVLGSLFYLSHSNGHRWMSAARRQKAVDQLAAEEAERQDFKRVYGRATADKS